MGVDPTFGHNHHSALEIMPNGDVLVAWFSNPFRLEYGPLVRIVQARLRCGAEEFDLPELFVKVKEDQDFSPCLWREGPTNWLFTAWVVPPATNAVASTSFRGGASGWAFRQ